MNFSSDGGRGRRGRWSSDASFETCPNGSCAAEKLCRLVKISCAVLFSETRNGCSGVMTLIDFDGYLEDVGMNQAHLSFLFSGAPTQHAIILWTV